MVHPSPFFINSWTCLWVKLSFSEISSLNRHIGNWSYHMQFVICSPLPWSSAACKLWMISFEIFLFVAFWFDLPVLDFSISELAFAICCMHCSIGFLHFRHEQLSSKIVSHILVIMMVISWSTRNPFSSLVHQPPVYRYKWGVGV